MYVNAHSSVFITAPEWKKIQIPVDGSMDKQNAVDPHRGLSGNSKKSGSTDTCYDVGEPGNTVLNGRSETRKVTLLYDSIYTKSPEEANLR